MHEWLVPCTRAQVDLAGLELRLAPILVRLWDNHRLLGSLACSGSGPLVGNVLWWEMSSHRKCPLTGNVLWWVFPCLCTFRPSGRKRLLVGKVMWWELSSGGACPTCFPTLLYLLNCSLQKLCLTRVCFPTTPAPPGVSFPPLLLHQAFLSHHSCFTRVCFTQFSSHHSCSTRRFFPTTPASQGFASHSSLPTTPVPQVFSFPPLLLHKGLLHTVLFPPLLFHKFFLLSHQSCSTRACFTQFSPHHSCSTRACFTQFSPHHSCFTRVLLPHHSCLTKVCFPTTPAPQRFVYPPLLLHKGLFHTVLHPRCSARLCLKTFHHSCFTETCFTRFSLRSGFTRLDHTRTTPASLEFASLDSPTTPV